MQPTEIRQINLPKSDDWVDDKPRVVKMALLSRIYIWSIIFEPLLFFVLFERTATGVAGNFSRILQLVVVIGIIFKLLVGKLRLMRIDILLTNFVSPLYFNYGIYFCLTFFAGIIGLLSGAYSLTASYDQDHNQSGFARLLNSGEIRPFFEYGIALYYFCYFTILPQYFLKTEKSVAYFFSVFKVVFIISFVVGVIDFLFSIAGIDFVPRHISDWRDVGMRFHGLAGEPRDGFIYLFFGLAMLHLQAYFRDLTLSKWWVVAVISAASLTQSASGLLGIMFFVGLYGIYSLGSLSMRQIGHVATLTTLTIWLVYIMATNSERIILYLEAALDVWFILEGEGELPNIIVNQAANIFPLYDLTVKFRDLNLLPIFIGSGFGSTSVINNFYFNSIFEMQNPHSQFVRTIFESGIIGIYFFIISFVYPVKYLTKHIPKKKRNEFIMFTLLLMGCFFGHRSSASFIYLGIFIASFRVYRGIYDRRQ
jgi:hypothetical protein